MQVMVNIDHDIVGRGGDGDRLADWVRGQVEDALGRFADQITRIEVHLNDENGRLKRRDGDKRCLVEARLAGLPPVAVSHHADAMREAVTGALDKMEKSLERKLTRFASIKGHTTED